MIKINTYLIEFAINSILREKSKNLFIFIVLTLLIFILSSIFFITASIQKELDISANSLPNIIVQKTSAGRVSQIDINRVDKILEINGVQNAVSRVWGYYYFENAGINFSVVGIDQFETQYKNTLESITKKHDFSELEDFMIVGSGVKRVLEENYYKDYFNFIKPDGQFKKLKIKAVFENSTNLESNDVILVSKEMAYEIFGLDENKATDIVVNVSNPKEVATIAYKIKLMYPDTRVITNEDIKISYANIFNYKSGMFLSLFIISLFTFFMIIYDKSSSLSSSAKREIGILKALGWRTDDILKEKFYESFIISFISYITGIALSLIFVYILQAPFLRDIFMGYSILKPQFSLLFAYDLKIFALLFFLSVPIYISATIFPSWRASIIDVDEVIR